jgi:ornithine decarboxylase
VRKNEKVQASEKLSTVWGCTCNSKDKILDSGLIQEMEIGDWMIFHNMGAYTNTVSTSFNGFSLGDIILVD